MLKSLLACSLFVFTAVAGAEDPPPVPKAVLPKAAQPKNAPVQPGGLGAQPGAFGRVTATTMARYEEEAEVLEAQLDVKKAYIRAADVGLAGAKVRFERAQKLETSKAIPPEDLAQAKLEVDAAIAQLEIRKAEAKEVEVRLKFSKKRVEDAKAGGVRGPARPAVDPIP